MGVHVPDILQHLYRVLLPHRGYLNEEHKYIIRKPITLNVHLLQTQCSIMHLLCPTWEILLVFGKHSAVFNISIIGTCES